MKNKILTLSFILFCSCQPSLKQNIEITEAGRNASLSEEQQTDAPEVAIGERLFRETRFAQFFAVNMQNNNVNLALTRGDPVLNNSETLAEPIAGPYRGLSMNCAACHQVDESATLRRGGMRTYADFARRSPIPFRVEDGKTHALRNSPPLVNSAISRTSPFLLHFDGEFSSTQNLVEAGFTGRNFGWLAREKSQAIAHIAKVVREDNGQGALARDYASFSYAQLLLANDPRIPTIYRIPAEFRIDVQHASDEEIVRSVSRLVAAYVDALKFSQNNNGEYNASPYDLFLEKNHLPKKPASGESDLDYSRRLLAQINALGDRIQFISDEDASFAFHEQFFKFGPEELDGLKKFFRQARAPLSPAQIMEGGIGNCISCHAAPHFTDFSFHNTGTTQEEYDLIHGNGSFNRLSIPSLSERNLNPNEYYPASHEHPDARGIFANIPSSLNSSFTDLGLWNVFANTDLPGPQDSIRSILCEQHQSPGLSCSDEALLPLSIALIKTPGLRDLGHSAPYLHNGSKNSLEDTLNHYATQSDLARNGSIRNGAKQLQSIALNENDKQAIVQFLKSLNEDYN